MIHLYCKSMGKIFRVKKIAQNEKEANDFCAKHADCGVIAVEQNLIFIAELYQITESLNFIK